MNVRALKPAILLMLTEKQLTWSRYDVESNDFRCDGWCPPTSFTQVGGYASGLTCAAAGYNFKDDMRIYYITEAGNLGELSPLEYDTRYSPRLGFQVTNTDILSSVVP